MRYRGGARDGRKSLRRHRYGKSEAGTRGDRTTFLKGVTGTRDDRITFLKDVTGTHRDRTTFLIDVTGTHRDSVTFPKSAPVTNFGRHAVAGTAAPPLSLFDSNVEREMGTRGPL